MFIVGTPPSLCLALLRPGHADLPRFGTALAVTATRLLRLAARFALLAAVSLWVTSCDEPPEPFASAPSSSQPAVSSALARRDWLTQHDRIAPERWLASRAADVDVEPDDPSVASMRALLLTAQQRFGDTTRMIANRAVQLEATLKAKGIDETAPDIIESFSRLAEAGPPLDGFGAMCQNYVILREQGMSKDAALEHLAEALRSSGASASAPSANSEVR